MGSRIVSRMLLYNAQIAASISLRNGNWHPPPPSQPQRWLTRICRAAELLTSMKNLSPTTEADLDSPMKNADVLNADSPPLARRIDNPREGALEAQETHRYLLAKSYFDTREYSRCAAVFLPPIIPAGGLPTGPKYQPRIPTTAPVYRERKKTYGRKVPHNPYPQLSQKSLFLALYARYMAGEKRKDEESEMVLGPADGGTTVNRELADLARGLEGWFTERKIRGLEDHGHGWLEYLYGVVLAKGKNEEEAKKWLIRAVHLFPFHWGAWHELNDLLGNIEDVSFPRRPVAQHELMTSVASSCLRRIARQCHDPHLPPLLFSRAVSSDLGHT